MTLKEKLLKESRNAIEDYAIRFACNVEPRLAEMSNLQRALKELDELIRFSCKFFTRLIT